MPVDYSRYAPNWKTEIRPSILERAKNACEFCGKANREFIVPSKCCKEPLFDDRNRCLNCRNQCAPDKRGQVGPDDPPLTRARVAMKALTLLAVVALASLNSCTGLISPSTQAKIDQASTKYQDATGISTGQTVSLLGKWWTDLQQAREINRLLKTEPIPYSPIQATKASPLMDYTSAKAVLEGINPQASAIPHAEPPAAAPAPGPEPGTIRRSDAHHRLQIAANYAEPRTKNKPL